MKIAIDGPAGAGKSTIARLVAGKLGYTYIDTGAMYRALTLQALRQSTSLDDGDSLTNILQTMNMEIVPGKRGNTIFINGENVTNLIRQPLVTEHVSQVASLPAVRAAMVRFQQQLATQGNVVMDGRDIGTVVMPDADLKIFLNASVTERAKRRQKELVRAGYKVNRAELEAEISTRDHFDATRKISPLKKAAKAIEIDTTSLSITEVVQLILSYSKQGR